jgi:hypothetical protein
MSTGLKAQEMVTIHGQVTDFKSNPIDSVTVNLVDASLKAASEGGTDCHHTASPFFIP